MSILRHHLCLSFTYNYIEFQDTNAEKLCMKYLFPSNTKGILYSDMLSVKEIPYAMYNDSLAGEIVKFNEFKYFSNLQRLSKILQGLEFKQFIKLEEIELPNCTVDNNMYRSFCYIYKNKISHLILPSNLSNISELVCLGALKENSVILVPKAVKAINSGAFSWCKNITFIFLGDTPPDVSKQWYYKNLTQYPTTTGYAPDGSVALYKANENLMANMCSDIKPLSQLPENISKQLWTYKLKFKS